MTADSFYRKKEQLEAMTHRYAKQMNLTLRLNITQNCVFAFVRFNFVERSGAIYLGELALRCLPLYVLEFIILHEIGHIVYSTQRIRRERSFYVNLLLGLCAMNAAVLGVYFWTGSIAAVASGLLASTAITGFFIHTDIKEGPSRKIGEEVFADFFAMKASKTDLRWVLIPVIALEPASEEDLTLRFKYVQELRTLPNTQENHTLLIDGIPVNLCLKDIHEYI